MAYHCDRFDHLYDLIKKGVFKENDVEGGERCLMETFLLLFAPFLRLCHKFVEFFL